MGDSPSCRRQIADCGPLGGFAEWLRCRFAYTSGVFTVGHRRPNNSSDLSTNRSVRLLPNESGRGESALHDCSQSCMLKRNGRVATEDEQLNLFDFLRPHEPANLPDPIRIDGGAALAGIPPGNGAGTGDEGHLNGSVIRGTGTDYRGDGNTHSEDGDRDGSEPAAGGDGGLGDDPGEVYSPSSGREPERLNTGNYRIRAEDGVGEGCLFARVLPAKPFDRNVKRMQQLRHCFRSEDFAEITRAADGCLRQNRP